LIIIKFKIKVYECSNSHSETEVILLESANYSASENIIFISEEEIFKKS